MCKCEVCLMIFFIIVKKKIDVMIANCCGTKCFSEHFYVSVEDKNNQPEPKQSVLILS